jgi:cytochrome c oxidase subunit 2
MRRQLQGYKAGRRGADEDDIYGRQMAPMANTLATDAAIENVIAHVQTFPDNPAPATIEGNVANGARDYVVCAYCHGADGRGIFAMNAPRLAGMTDWYLANQLRNFRDGVRGDHPQDFYGMQMSLMVGKLNDQRIDDLLAYINTL